MYLAYFDEARKEELNKKQKSFMEGEDFYPENKEKKVKESEYISDIAHLDPTK